MLLDGERGAGAGNEYGNPESEKWEQKKKIGNEITDRAYRLGFKVGHL